MKLALLAVAMCLVGCGPDFTGSYSGALADNGPCSNGNSVNGSSSYAWTVTDNGGAVQATSADPCSPFNATAAGNVANISAKQCVPVVTNGSTVTGNITDGTLALNGGVLAVLIHTTDTVTGSASGTCSVVLSGNLTKQ